MSQAHILLVEGDIPDSGGYQPQLEADGFAVHRVSTRWKNSCLT